MKLLSFSLTADCIIITYEDKGKEITIVIDPFTLCTHLMDIDFISDRKRDSNGQVMVAFLGGWQRFAQFAFDIQYFRYINEYLVAAVLERHLETERINDYYYTTNN